jgi:peptidyl-prolyl cis-trans isomerase B (cyclophilin B)
MKAARVWAASLACLLVAGVVTGCSYFEEQQPLRETPRPPPAPQPEARPAEPPVPVKESYPVVILETSEGTIRIELWPDKAPKTVANFLQYVDDGFYDGTIFHRVIDGFMIQGGGLTADMQEKPTRPPIKSEASADVPNTTGTIAMARTNAVDSATGQFFINVANNAFLDHRDNTPEGFGYAVFGSVTEGMDVVDRIRSAPTGRRGYYDDVPTTPVIIKSIRRAAGR